MRKPDPVALAAQICHKALPPVDEWNPPLGGDMDMLITRNGTWFYRGTPIERETMVRLFSTILRREEDDHYYLVTPAEKWRIQVEDAPFLAVLLTQKGAGREQQLRFITNVGDEVTAGPEHPIRVDYASAGGEPSPYVHIRARLWALISRSVFLQLAELGEERDMDGERLYGVWSQTIFFPLGSLHE